MARDRFSDLEAVYDALNTANVNFANLPANLPYVKYAKWRRGEDNGTPEKTITRPDLEGEEDAGLIAFGLAHDDDNGKIIITTNKRAVDFANSLSFVAKFKLLIRSGGTPPTLTGYIKNSSYSPAVARIRKRTGTTQTTETSAITGNKYKKYPGGSYTVPMGQGTIARRYQEAVLDILTSINADTTLSASFKEEQWRRD